MPVNRLRLFGWISLGLIMTGVLSLTGFYITQNDPVPVNQPAQQVDADAELAEALEQLIEESEAEEAARPEGETTATLDSLRDNGNEFAVATRKFNSIENEFEFEIVATLGDPQVGSSYLVFITDGPTSLRVGTLNKEVENTFALSARFTEDISNLNEVVVIESGASQEDVLQGVFE